MSRLFEELDYRETPIGAISLRRRHEPRVGRDVHEIKLDEEFLMSSLFTEAEEELARLGLAEVTGGGLDVVVGGLGLGYTAREVLRDDRVGALCVVEALPAVIDWHREGLLPLGSEVAGDERCALAQGSFHALTLSGAAYDEKIESWDAILVDIDHSPANLLDPGHAALYEGDGLAEIRRRLKPGGVFGLWSDDPPEDRFMARLEQVFETARAEVVNFDNPLMGGQSANTVYLASI